MFIIGSSLLSIQDSDIVNNISITSYVLGIGNTKNAAKQYGTKCAFIHVDAGTSESLTCENKHADK